MSLSIRLFMVFVFGLCSACMYSKDETGDLGGGTAMPTYTNPLNDGMVMGDPFVLKHGERYYLFGTTDPEEGFQCYASSNLVAWKAAGFAYRNTRDAWATPPFWAPEVIHHQGRFYMTYSGRDKVSGRLLTALAVSDHPEGPYRDLYAPWFDPGYSVIDSHVFVDHDGRAYLYFSRNGEQDGYSYGIIHGAPLRSDLAGLTGSPVKLLEADQEWEKINYEANRCNEGPFVIKRQGVYYMLYSANHTFRPGYGIGYATSDSPLGPWTKSPANPLAGTDPGAGYSGAGHCSITMSPDGSEFFMVYHTHADPADPENGQRTVNIDRIRFEGDGSVIVVGPTRSPQPLPSGAR